MLNSIFKMHNKLLKKLLTFCLFFSTPLLHAQDISFNFEIDCASTSLDLTTQLNIENQSSGTLLTFHTSDNPTNDNRIDNPSRVTAGIYYATFYDPVGNCYSPVTGIEVTKVLCNKCPNNTIDLNTLSFLNQPLGTIVSTHSNNPVSNSNRLSAISASGTYYLSFYDQDNDCYSPAVPIEIVIEDCCTMVQPTISFSNS